MTHSNKRILVPVDFSEGSAKAVEFGLRLARKLDGELELLHAVTSPPPASPLDGLDVAGELDPDQLVEERRRKLESWAQRFESEGLPIHKHVARGEPAEIIVEVAREHQVDHIVMGTHSRHGLERFVKGGVAKDVVQRAPCPVTTVRKA